MNRKKSDFDSSDFPNHIHQLILLPVYSGSFVNFYDTKAYQGVKEIGAKYCTHFDYFLINSSFPFN
jgi:hypothetical protein